MEVKIHEKEIQKLVFKTLCHVLVEKRLYHKFRCFIGHQNQCTVLYTSLRDLDRIFSFAQRRGSRDNPFINAATRKDVYTIMSNIGEPLKPRNENNIAMIQNRVISLLNALLHGCVEGTASSIMEVENIGRETFNLVCEQIFGKDFVDETEKDVPENVKMMRQLQEEYSKENGNADPKLIGFMEWISKHHQSVFGNNEPTWNVTTANTDDIDWDDEFIWDVISAD